MITVKSDIGKVFTLTPGEFKKEIVKIIEWALSEKEYPLADYTAVMAAEDLTGIFGNHGVPAEGMKIIQDELDRLAKEAG